MKKIIHIQFPYILSCAGNIHLLKQANLIYTRIRNEIYETKNISQKSGKIHPIFPGICSYNTLLYSCEF